MEPTSQYPMLSMENRPFKRREDSLGWRERKDIDSPGKGLGAAVLQIKEGDQEEAGPLCHRELLSFLPSHDFVVMVAVYIAFVQKASGKPHPAALVIKSRVGAQTL